MENSARRLTDKFICLMLFALPLWPGLEGYSDITGAKFRLFAALTLVWLAALGVCAALMALLLLSGTVAKLVKEFFAGEGAR